LSCNFKTQDKPIVSNLWLIASRVLGILFLVIYAVLHIAGYFPEWDYFKIRPLKSGYLFTPIIFGYIGNSLKYKKIMPIDCIKEDA